MPTITVKQRKHSPRSYAALQRRSRIIPSQDVTALILAYIAVAVLLLGLNLHSQWHWSIKTLCNLVVVGFFWVVYNAWPNVQGWPTHRNLPEQFFLHAVNIDEPQNIYLWGTEFTHGMEQTAPRAYRLPYTPALHDKVDKATRKLRKGLPVIGQITPNNTAPSDLGALDQTQISDSDIEFIDAPRSLIPGKN